MAYQNDRIKQIPAPLPKDYDRQTNFTDFQTANPGKPMQGANLDAEFNVIEQALDETQARQRLIQRDDGALQNGIVTRDALSSEVIAGVKSPTTWTSGAVYAESDSVIVYDQPGQTDPAWYVAEVGHTATTFSTDLAAGNWRLLVDLSSLLADAGQTVVTTSEATRELSDSLDVRALFSDLFDDFVVSGGLPGTSVDLTTDTPATVAYVSGSRVSAALESHAYTASMDTYVDLGKSGAFSYTEVASGAGAPAVPADHIRLAKVVADADNITSVDDLRVTLAALKSVVDATNANVTTASGAQAVQGALDGRVIRAASLTALKAIDGTNLPAGAGARITDTGRVGDFRIVLGDFSAKVAIDTLEGWYVPVLNRPTTVAIWKRVADHATIEHFGGVADWDGATGTDNSGIIDVILQLTEIKAIRGSGGDYYFGDIAQNEQRFNVTRDIDIDWRGSKLVCAGDNSVSGTSAALFRFTDCRMNMRNYRFLDVNFLFAGPSRGVAPVFLWAAAASTSGHRLTGFHVEKGQSLLTCVSDDPINFRSKGIVLKGTADDVYYGFNGANNGDGVRADYHIDRVNRGIFVYGVNDVVANYYVREGQASSSNLLISALGTGNPDTENVTVNAVYGTLDGPIDIVDQPAANGTGVYRNIELNVRYETLGANITTSDAVFNIGAFDNLGGFYTTEKTVNTEDIRIDLTKGAGVGLQTSPIVVRTPSPNYGELYISGNNGYQPFDMYPLNASSVNLGPVLYANGRISRTITGDLTRAGAVCNIPSKYLGRDQTNDPIIANLRVTATDNAGGKHTYAEYSLIGQLSAAGVFTLTRAQLIHSDSTGGVTPTITIAAAAGGAGLDVSIDSYSGSFAYLTASLNWI